MKRRYVVASGSSSSVAVGDGCAPSAATGERQWRSRRLEPISSPRHTKSSNLYYHGAWAGSGRDGAEGLSRPLGSQWNNNNDPSGEAVRLQELPQRGRGSSWLNSVTQYCQGIANGSSVAAAFAATRPASSPAPGRTTPRPLRPAEPVTARRRASRSSFRNTGQADTSTQYVIALRPQHRPVRHPVLRYHSSTSSSTHVAYTTCPTSPTLRRGVNCQQRLRRQPTGSRVPGHERPCVPRQPRRLTAYAATPNAATMRLISSGQGASQNINLSNTTFAVQSLGATPSITAPAAASPPTNSPQNGRGVGFIVSTPRLRQTVTAKDCPLRQTNLTRPRTRRQLHDLETYQVIARSSDAGHAWQRERFFGAADVRTRSPSASEHGSRRAN